MKGPVIVFNVNSRWIQLAYKIRLGRGWGGKIELRRTLASIISRTGRSESPHNTRLPHEVHSLIGTGQLFQILRSDEIIISGP